MHADLVKLLDLQAKDTLVNAAERRVEALRREYAALEAALEEGRARAQAARRAVADGVGRRDALEASVEQYRAAQQRRQQRLDQVRTPKEASAAMAELELGGSALANEEAEWVQSAEQVEQLELKARELEAGVEAGEAAQQPERERLGAQLAQLEQARDEAIRAREESAEQVERSLRLHYDRLRRSRGAEVVVPLVGATCGACFTAVPLNRRTQIRAGQMIGGCEACGAILYPSDGQ